MKMLYLIALYIGYWFLVCIRIKMTKDINKQATVYRKADIIEHRMFKLVG